MKLFRWILLNSLFVATIYYGLFEEVEGAKNVALGMAWVSIFLSFFLPTEKAVEATKDLKRTVPAWISVTLDIVVTLAFLWCGYAVTAALYFLHILLTEVFWRKKEDKQAECATE